MSSLRILRLLLLLVFILSLMIWILIPTKIYKNTWTPKLQTHLNSTYFREQGTNLLLFTFPMMLIGALGCIYLHLLQKKTPKPRPRMRRGALGWLKQPVVVISPLGIVTAMELCFAAMFCALMIWSLANYLHTSFSHLHRHDNAKLWQDKFRSVSLRVGYIGNTCWAFLFLPVTRGSSILPLLGLTSESSIKFHIWLGHLSNFLFAAHTVGFFIFWAMTGALVDAVEWSKTYVSNVAGEIAMVIAVAMWVTSMARVRRKRFEVFFYTHHLYGLYILFYAIHVGVAYMCMIAPSIFLFLIDRHLRFLQSRQPARLLSARLLPSHTLELTFSKTPGLTYNPTSIVFINVPSISKLQWHPFTVTSNCNMERDKLSVVIKTVGSWSSKLYDTLSSQNLNNLQVSVEGPYGPSSSHFLRHEVVVMVSGGSGITPFISIIRELVFQSPQPNTHLPRRVLLVSSFKNSSDLTILRLMLPLSASPSPSQFSNLQLQIEAYVTRETQEEHPTDHIHNHTQNHNAIRTIWFKPLPTDLPISAVLGPNNWLWLGAIITSSFLMFLLLLGIVTRYHIYPVESNAGDEVYPWTYKVLWFLFLICATICVCSSVVFLWCKRQNGLESKQILNVEGPTPTPTTSPAGTSSCDNGMEQELESIPHQCLVQATNVHYGARSDLKKILLECKEEDVGVLVCGPKKMRHDVAKICSSGLANNLHFEAISFNW